MKFDYKKYIAGKHAKFQTPDDVLDQVIFKATNQKSKERIRLVIGEVNEVYDVKTEDNTNVILRISREQGFESEAWAMEQSQSLGVPVPKVLLIDETKTPHEKLYVCVLSKVTGTPLTNSGKMKDDGFMRNVLIQAGHYLSIIHQATTRGWGHLHGNGEGEFKTFKEYAKDLLKKEELFKSVSARNNIYPNVISGLIKELQSRHQDLKLRTPVLLHGDFSPKHIMVEDKKVTSILDFGNCRGGFSIHDLAWWSFWWRNPKHIEWLKEGYDNKEAFENFDFNFHMAKGFLDLELLYWTDHTKHLHGIETAIENMTEDLEYLRNI